MNFAVDVGFGAVKGMCDARTVEYPSYIGSFRPIRFTSGMENKDVIDKLCVSYNNKPYFVGKIAHTQSTPRTSMNTDRFINQEGMTLMLATFILLSNSSYTSTKLVTGLPVNDFSILKNRYRDTLLNGGNPHYIQLIEPDFKGSGGEYFSFLINDAKILPQPIGTIFNEVLDDMGNLVQKDLAGGRLAVLDIGKHTVDLALTDALQFVDKSSVSFNDIGLFDVYKELSIELKNYGYDIAPDSLEPHIKGNKSISVLNDIKEEYFESQADKILSRVYNIWPDLWSFNHVYITGGGASVIGHYISQYLSKELDVHVTVCSSPSLTNCQGYFKFAKKAWG